MLLQLFIEKEKFYIIQGILSKSYFCDRDKIFICLYLVIHMYINEKYRNYRRLREFV